MSDFIIDFWTSLTEAQAIVLSGGFTFLAAVFAVVVGNFVLKGKVSTIEEAISASKDAVDTHLENVEKTIPELKKRLETLDGLILALGDRISQIQDEEAEYEGYDIEPSGVDGPRGNLALADNIEDVDTILDTWRKIRELVEKMARRDAVDGRTRAKYLRVDRRKFGDLIISMGNDGNLPLHQDVARALEIRNRYRNRRNSPDPADVREILDIHANLRDEISSRGWSAG